MGYMKGGLIKTLHNKIRDGVVDLIGKVFTTSLVRDNPLIHPGRSVREGKAQSKGNILNNPPVEKETLEQNGDLLIPDLWQIGTDNIHDTRIMNTYALSHQNKLLENFLQTAEKDNKQKYLED